ncbi:transcription termination factor Rho [bacterium]|nr:transcription termination factor Rho [bacterium]MBQ6436437.1 transcription termination factor Rho [bacterium]
MAEDNLAKTQEVKKVEGKESAKTSKKAVTVTKATTKPAQDVKTPVVKIDELKNDNKEVKSEVVAAPPTKEKQATVSASVKATTETKTIASGVEVTKVTVGNPFVAGKKKIPVFGKQAVGFRSSLVGVSQSNASSARATRPVKGFLDTFRENMAVIRVNYAESEDDTFVPPNFLRKYKLQPGDVITGLAREPKETDRYWGLTQIDSVNGLSLEEYLKKPRVKFHQLTPVYPDEQIKLETAAEPLSTRIVDLIAPIGKGQRSLIVSPPKAGKTSLLKEISTGVAANYPDIFLMAVLIGERPEEVTDLRRHIEKITNGRGEVAASNFDEAADNQCRVAELALERAKRLVEKGMDVVILLDSITRLARAYNLSIPTSGRTLSGGFDPAALFPPKRFFGAARNFEVPGSLTIIGTALVDTGSRMDDLVYEEFKGTGNQELHLDRRLAERRIYPAIEVQKSGTRRDDLLIDPMTYQAVLTLQRMLDTLPADERTVTLMTQMRKTKSNKEFLQSLRSS